MGPTGIDHHTGVIAVASKSRAKVHKPAVAGRGEHHACLGGTTSGSTPDDHWGARVRVQAHHHCQELWIGHHATGTDHCVGDVGASRGMSRAELFGCSDVDIAVVLTLNQVVAGDGVQILEAQGRLQATKFSSATGRRDWWESVESLLKEQVEAVVCLKVT